MHYLDDFLLIGSASSPICQRNLNIFTQACADLGVPLAAEKTKGPSTQLTFLGILLDTNRMEIHLPNDKLQHIRTELASWLQKESATKREILSLVGLLQHATKVVRSGRTFVAQMYQSTAKLKKLKYFTRLTQSFRSDVYWWYTFIVNWNGQRILRKPDHTNHVNFRVFTDVSGSWGCGAQWERCWFQWQWPLEWHPIRIMAKELVPIVISCAVWGPCLAHKTVLFFCDYISVVTVVAKGYSRDKTVMHFLRSLWFFAAIFYINIVSQHIPGVVNIPADMLSRNNLTQFFFSQPQADRLPTPLPPPFLYIVSPWKPDWTSHSFRRWFTDTITVASPQPPILPTPMANNVT